MWISQRWHSQMGTVSVVTALNGRRIGWWGGNWLDRSRNYVYPKTPKGTKSPEMEWCHGPPWYVSDMQDVYFYKNLASARQNSKPLASCKAIVLVFFSPLIKTSYNWSSTRKVNMNISKPVYFSHCTHWGKCMIFACNHAAVETEFWPTPPSSFGLPTPVRKTKFSRPLSLVKVIATVWCVCDFFFFCNEESKCTF